MRAFRDPNLQEVLLKLSPFSYLHKSRSLYFMLKMEKKKKKKATRLCVTGVTLALLTVLV